MPSICPDITTLSVGRYYVPLPSREKNWSFLFYYPDSPIPRKAISYKIEPSIDSCGSIDYYKFAEPETVTPIYSPTYMGEINVGWIDYKQIALFETVLQSVRIKSDDLEWRREHWIVDALRALKASGFNVRALNLNQLTAELDRSRRF
ncbi:hypothetical protein C8J56DRAFT_1097227 [Mycena floridula]|nr:hypothetical protein C8J56DRAFT_1097227 [Mycena floridula]